MDVHVRRAITVGLRNRGVDVVTAQDDNTTEMEDHALLDRATTLERVLFSQDADLLEEATRRQRLGVRFGGVIYCHQLHITIGHCIRDLEVIAKVGMPADMLNRVQFLPL